MYRDHLDRIKLLKFNSETKHFEVKIELKDTSSRAKLNYFWEAFSVVHVKMEPQKPLYTRVYESLMNRFAISSGQSAGNQPIKSCVPERVEKKSIINAGLLLKTKI